MYDFSSWQQAIKDLGIKAGDTVYVASDITLPLRDAYKEGVRTKADRDNYLHELINMLQKAVGNEGTLLFPVFTWAFCRGKGFDAKTTLGEVGSLNNWILQNRTDFIRTRHPIYSFMVWGRAADLLAALDNISGWGNNSPFAYLHYNGGKMLYINVSLQRSLTFMHYVEEAVKVPYRYTKAFRGSYTDSRGKTTEKIYTMYVRDLAIQSAEYMPDEFLLHSGIMQEKFVQDISLKSLDLNAAYEPLKEDLLKNGAANFYKFTDYKLDWEVRTHEDDFSNGLP